MWTPVACASRDRLTPLAVIACRSCVSRSVFLDAWARLKDYAKLAAVGASPSLSEPVARWLYLAALARALVSHGTRISSHDAYALRAGFAWAAHPQHWPDAPLADVFSQALRVLDGSPT